MKQPAVVFDRDGTLASVAYCAPKTRSSEEWRCYNGLLPFDAVVPRVAGLLHSIRPGITRIMFSGRAAGDREGDWHRYYVMQSWLRKNHLPIDRLYMRRGGDMRQDSIIKNEMLDEISEHFDVLYAFDDRPQVCQAVWEARGVPLLKVQDPGILPPIVTGEYPEEP